MNIPAGTMFARRISTRSGLAGRYSAVLRLAALACGVWLSGLSCSEVLAQSPLMPGAPAGVGNIATGRRAGSTPAPEKACSSGARRHSGGKGQGGGRTGNARGDRPGA